MMETVAPDLGRVALYGAIAGAATFAGIFAVLGNRRWAERNLPRLLGFAAGVLIGGALLHVTGAAAGLAGLDLALLAVALSFTGFALLEMALRSRHRDGGEAPGTDAPRDDGRGDDGHAGRRRLALGTVAPLGLLLHSALDGLVLGVGVLAPGPAWVLLLVVVAHEVPEGLAGVSSQLRAGVGRRATLVRSAGIALATPVGALLGYVLLRGMGDVLLGLLLAVGAGSFLYVGAADLLPESAERTPSPGDALAFAAGVALMVGVELAGA